MTVDARVPEEWQPVVDAMVEELMRLPVEEMEMRLHDFRAVAIDRIRTANPSKSELECGIAAGVLAEAIRDRLLSRTATRH